MIKSEHNKGIAALIVALLIAGAMPPLIKIAVREITPEAFTFFRFLISGIILLPFFLKEKVKLDNNLLKLGAISLLATVNVLLFAHGLKLTTASIGQTLYILVPIIVATITYLSSKEKIAKKKLLGVLLGLFGGFILILLPVIGTSSFGNIFGNLLITTAVISFSIYSLFSKKTQTTYNFSPVHLTMVFSVVTVLVLLFPFIKQLGTDSNMLSHVSREALFSLLYVGALGTAAYYVLYHYGLKYSGTTNATTTIFYLQPITTVFFSVALLREIPTPGFIMGGLIAAAGAWLVIKSR